MNGFPTLSGIIHEKMGGFLFGDCFDTETGPSNTPREIDTEPLLSWAEKSIRTFEEDVLRRENRELKGKCEKLVIQLRCKDIHRQAQGEKLDQASDETSVPSAGIYCGESEMKRFQCDLESFRAMARRVQDSKDDWLELRNGWENSLSIVAELNCTRREQDMRMEQLVCSNKLLMGQLMKCRGAVLDRECKCEALAAEVAQSASRTADLLQQLQQLKRALAEERKINTDLTVSIRSAERASADSLSSLRSISTSNVSIANSQYALIEELRGFLKRCSGMDQVAAHSTCAPPHCPAAADPPSRAGDAEGGPSCLAKRSRRDDPAEEASVQHPVPHVHAVVAETGDQDKRAEVPVRVRGRERERPHVVPGKCPECAEAGFGLMMSCGGCGASFHSMCARKVRQRLSSPDPQQRFVCSDCACVL